MDRHLLAGLDERGRGFTRTVDIEGGPGPFRALFRYEALVLSGEGSESSPGALAALVAALHVRGYRQLRTRLNFRGDAYLGTQEPWIEYPDPDAPAPEAGLISRWWGWLRGG